MNASEELQLFIDGLTFLTEYEFTEELVNILREKYMQKVLFAKLDEEFRRPGNSFTIEYESGVVENPQSEFRRADTL